jgi:hypothetical protein
MLNKSLCLAAPLDVTKLITVIATNLVALLYCCISVTGSFTRLISEADLALS